MLTDWSALCSPEDPVLVVPWSDPTGKLAWVEAGKPGDAPELADYIC